MWPHFCGSGGKDSCFNLLQCVAEGHQVVALANLRPKSKDKGECWNPFIQCQEELCELEWNVEEVSK